MALTAEQIERCAEWVKRHTWQVLNRSQWKYEFTNKTLIRYVDEVKLNEDPVEALLEYLTSDDCKETLRLYDQSIGEEWTPYRAWLEPSGSAAGHVRAVRLCHGLVENPDGADGPYLVEDGCAAKVTWTYYWNQPSVIDCPKSTSGISYHISNLSRDQETGLYTYALEKRERVQQDLSYTASDDAHGTVKVEQHLGVREGNKAQYESQVGVSEDGTVTTIQESKNSDCTTDISLRSTKRTQGDLLGESCSDNIFEKRHGTSTQAVDSYTPGSHVQSASGGIIHSRTAKKGEDGKWDLSEDTNTEHPVSDASTTVEKSLRGVAKSVTHRNQAAPAETEGLDVGQSVHNEKTPGGLWNITLRTFLTESVGWIRKACQKTIFQHSHSATSNVATDPGFEHVAEASGGVIHEKTVSKTENGTYDVAESTTTELAVYAAGQSVSKTLRGKRVSTTDRNVATPHSTDNLPVGTQVTNEKTPGGLYNRTITQTVAEPAGIIRETCGDDAFTHNHATVRNVANDPGLEHVVEAEGGVTHEEAVTHNDDGTYDVHESTRTEHPGLLAESEHTNWEETVHSTTTRGTDGDVSCSVEVGRVTQKSARKTQGNLQDLTVTTETAGAAVLIVKEWADDYTMTRYVFYRNQVDMPNPANYMFPNIKNKVSVSTSYNKFKLFDGTIIITISVEKDGALWMKAGSTRRYYDSVNYSYNDAGTTFRCTIWLRRYYFTALYSSADAAYKAYWNNADVARYKQDGPAGVSGNRVFLWTSPGEDDAGNAEIEWDEAAKMPKLSTASAVNFVMTCVVVSKPNKLTSSEE